MNSNAILGVILIATLYSCAAIADEMCLEDKLVPAHMECDKYHGQSADFTSGCRYVPEHTVKVEKPCPITWVAPYGAKQSVACAIAGLRPASVNGQICASGIHRPIGVSGISYPFGIYGPATGGGTKLDNFTHVKQFGRDTRENEYTGYTLCLKNEGAFASPSTSLPGVYVLVAYACKP